MFSQKAILLVITWLVGLSGGTAALAAPAWVEQGPGPIFNVNIVEGLPGPNPAAGAINAIVADPTTADIVFVGTVNGGVWKTSNATAATPTWTPLTDQQLPALSMNSLAVSPVSPSTLFAGTGSTSSLSFRGSSGFGVARSTNVGATWIVLARSTFAGRRIDSIVPTRLSGGNVVLAATLFDGGGVYRSTDNGVSFTRISGNATSILPDAGVSKLIADPSNSNRFYAGVPASFGGGPAAGVYRSDDGGLTWTAASAGVTGLATSYRILLSVHNDATNNVVYAAVIVDNGVGVTPRFTLSGVFRSTNQGGSWTSLGVPAPPIYPGGQGNIHGALAADPTSPNVVFIAGDRQDSPFPNANGCTRFSANVFRYTGTAWENVVCNGALGTSPHADSRDMQFDADGNLLQANDGGIYRLVNPSTAGTRRWVPVVGDIRPTEYHSVAFDPLSKVTFGGTQDNGTPIQLAPGAFPAGQLVGGDGGVVAVDADHVAHPGTTLRYSSSQFFGCCNAAGIGNFNRTTWNAANTRIGGFTLLGLNIVAGPGVGQTLYQFDPNIQFYNPYVLNAIDPSRMLIGTENIYESMNRGDSLNNLGATGASIGGAANCCHPMAYGGRLNDVDHPEVFYVGAGATIYHRVSASIIALSAYPGSTVRTIVMNPQNYRQVFVSDNQNRVWGSFDEGTSWVDLTANFLSLSSFIWTLEVFSPDATIRNTVLIAGGGDGIFQMRRPGAAGASWTALSSGFPKALVQDLHYDYTNDVLVAGTLGRGSWTLSSFFRGGGGTGAIASQTPSQHSTPANIPPPLDLPPIPAEANLPTPPIRLEP
jgi:hypothetical protein